MSTCISAAGEFSSHDLDDEHTCRDCGVLDDGALRAELRKLRALAVEGGELAQEQAGWADKFRAERDALRAELIQLRGGVVPTLAEARGRRLPLDGQALARTNFESTDYSGNDHEGVTDIERANLITSIVEAGGLSHLGGDFAMHKVVIDVDLPVRVIESSTPGHFHLFIDHEMTWLTYVALLRALTAAGIVEPGYLAAAQGRGHTAVRLPWVRKPAVVPAPLPLPAAPGCTCVGLDHRHGCPQWVPTL
jgi:hypothetical protein